MVSKPNSHLHHSMQTALRNREARGMKRTLKSLPSTSTDFSSNDFLSLSTSPSFRSTYLSNLTSASSTLRLSGTGSRLLDGNSAYAEDLESFIATFHNAETGLLFTSGFHCNHSVYACVPQPGDVIVFDELIHASTHDGMRASRAGRTVSFGHNSVESFERVLRAEKERDELVRDGKKSVFVAVESLYSMDGDIAPIKEMLDVLEDVLPEGNGYMIVDEAHSTGIVGPRGAGVVQELGVEGRVFLRLHTFGKALAGNGAIALCSRLTKEYLINYARPLIFTTALGLPTLVLIRTAYELMASGATQPLQSRLQHLITTLRTSLLSLPSTPLLSLKHHPTSPIFALITPYPRDLAQACQDAGLIARPIMPPTVPRGTQRVRVCLHAGNTVEEVGRLVGVVGGWVERMGKGREDLDGKGRGRGEGARL